MVAPTATREGPMKRISLAPALPYLVMVLAVALVFGRALGNQFLLNWDDYQYVVDNPAIRGFSWHTLYLAFTTNYGGNFAPVQIISYMVDYLFWGVQPSGYILTNLLLHTANGLLCYRLLLRLGSRCRPALFGAMLFLCHPVQVESVVWVSQRKNLLAMGFFLVALLAYVQYREGDGLHGRRFYWLSVAAFILALMTKSVAVVLPLVLLCHDTCRPQAERRQRGLVALLPYVAGAALVGLLTIFSQSHAMGGGRVPYHGGSPFATMLTMLPVLVRYFGLLFWPLRLSAVYNPPVKTAVDGEVLAAALFLGLLVALGAWLYRHRRQEFFWFAVIFIGLLPVMQIVPIITLMNDRYLYFPMVGVAGLAAAGLTTLGETGWRRTGNAGGMLLLVFLALLSWSRVGVWHDALTLWSDAVAWDPANPTALVGLGEVYLRHGATDRAEGIFREANRACPTCRSPVVRLAAAALEKGDLAAAFGYINQLLRDAPREPDGHHLLGNYHYLQGDLAGAETAYKRALELKPGLATVRGSLGNVYLGTGRPDLARREFLAALPKDGENAMLEYSLACAEALLGNPAEAVRRLENAVAAGFNRFDLLASNHELDTVRHLPRFQQLMKNPAAKGTVP